MPAQRARSFWQQTATLVNSEGSRRSHRKLKAENAQQFASRAARSHAWKLCCSGHTSTIDPYRGTGCKPGRDPLCRSGNEFDERHVSADRPEVRLGPVDGESHQPRQ